MRGIVILGLARFSSHTDTQAKLTWGYIITRQKKTPRKKGALGLPWEALGFIWGALGLSCGAVGPFLGALGCPQGFQDAFTGKCGSSTAPAHRI